MKKTIERFENISHQDRFIVYFFLLGAFLKQFYVFKNGSIQPGDACFMLSFALAIIHRRIKIYKIDAPIFAFILFAITINSLYSMYYGDTSFMKYSLYLVFSAFIILLYRTLFYNTAFLQRLLLILKINLLTQLIIFVFGFGRWIYRTRYGGTFNDPNQYGYFILATVLLIYTICATLETEANLAWYFLALFEISLSTSAGMVLGFIVFSFAYIGNLATTKGDYKARGKRLLLIMLTLIVVVAIIIGKRGQTGRILLVIDTGIKRFLNKMRYGFSVRGILETYLRDRSLMRLFEQSWFLLYGSGEGRWYRFSSGNEIHCTMLGLWYYYGIVPYSFFLKWLHNNLCNMKKKTVPVYFAFIFEAFNLANHRQPFFWILIIMASNEKLKRTNKMEYNNEKKLISR